ncbi:MAG TPA: hypothetical protein VII38_22335 [Polyangia bacterium]|jgi:hypothetical protein
MSFLILALVFAALPVGGLLWIRWRFQPARMRENAERMLRETEAKMEARSDEELVAFFHAHPYLRGTVDGAPAVTRIFALVDAGEFARLAGEWAELWSELLDTEVKRAPKAKPKLLDYSLELNAAATVLARRHPEPSPQ